MNGARTRRPAASLAAYVLHSYDWSESSVVLELFTREQGRVAAVAKGAKRPYSQLRAVLLPFQRLQVVLGRAPTPEAAAEIQTLRAAEWAGGPPMPTGAALFSGFYLNELLMRLVVRSDPQALLFDAYAQTLPALTASDEVVSAALRAFELTLLRQAGVLPDLSLVTLTQQAVQPGEGYALDAESGVMPAAPQNAHALSGHTLLALEAALQHGSLAALQQACLPQRAALKAVLRMLLLAHLGAPLRIRQAMRELHLLDR